MIDAGVIFCEWLTSSAAVTALVPAEHIICPGLPQGANPGAGEHWIAFRVRGGKADLEAPVIAPEFQVTAWAKSQAEARAIYRAVFDTVHGAQLVALTDGVVLSGLEQVQGQDITDPQTAWASVTAFFQVIMRPTA